MATLIAVFLLPETLASTILRKKAARLNKEHKDTGKRFVTPSDLEEESSWEAYVRTPCSGGRAMSVLMGVTLTIKCRK